MRRQSADPNSQLATTLLRQKFLKVCGEPVELICTKMADTGEPTVNTGAIGPPSQHPTENELHGMTPATAGAQ
jgi:hypothetical protein